MQLHCVIICDNSWYKFLFLGPDDADAFKQGIIGIIGYCNAGYAARTEDALLLDAGAKDPYQQPACRVLITLSWCTAIWVGNVWPWCFLLAESPKSSRNCRSCPCCFPKNAKMWWVFMGFPGEFSLVHLFFQAIRKPLPFVRIAQAPDLHRRWGDLTGAWTK